MRSGQVTALIVAVVLAAAAITVAIIIAPQLAARGAVQELEAQVQQLETQVRELEAQLLEAEAQLQVAGTQAQVGAIEKYVQNVYTAAIAYLVEFIEATPEDFSEDCSLGYSTKGGEYFVDPLIGAGDIIATCTVEIISSGDTIDAQIRLQQIDGTEWSFP